MTPLEVNHPFSSIFSDQSPVTSLASKKWPATQGVVVQTSTSTDGDDPSPSSKRRSKKLRIPKNQGALSRPPREGSQPSLGKDPFSWLSLEGLRSVCSVPEDVVLIPLEDFNKVDPFIEGIDTFYCAPQLEYVRFPLHTFIAQVLKFYQITLAQLNTNEFRILYYIIFLNERKSHLRLGILDPLICYRLDRNTSYRSLVK